MRNHFEREIVFLVNYDKTKNKIQEEIDMPDKLIDLFIKCVIQNKGEVGKQKRVSYFNKLTDQEINTLQSIVRECMLDSDADV